MKELRLKDTVKAITVMFAATMAAGGGLNFFSHINNSPIAIIAIELIVVLFCAVIIPYSFKQEDGKEIDQYY